MDEKREDAVFLQKAGQLLTQFWEKLKEIWDSPKRYQLLLIIGAVGIGMIFCSELGEKPTEQKETTADSGETISLCQEDGEYLAATEQRLEKMIEQIDGAGKCSVMITLKHLRGKGRDPARRAFAPSRQAPRKARAYRADTPRPHQVRATRIRE